MSYEIVHEKDEIEAFLRKDVPLHIYELGDLDDFYWPHTIWYAMRESGKMLALVIVYTAEELPAILALCDGKDVSIYGELMRSISHLIPIRFYLHGTPGIEKVLSHSYGLTPIGAHHRMLIKNAAPLAGVNTSSVSPFSIGDIEELIAFYELSYPGYNLSMSLVKVDMYWGVKKDSRIVSAGGVHV